LKAGLFGNFSRTLRAWAAKSVLLGITVAGLILLGLIARQNRKKFRNAASSGSESQYSRSETNKELGPELLLLFVLVPWIIVIFASLRSEYLATTRFWWIWPGQVIVLSATLTFIPRYFKVRPIIVSALQVFVVALVVLNPVLISRIQSQLSDGWSGADSDEKKVVDFIADQVGGGRKAAAIGYQTFFYGWMRRHSTLDPRVKVGMEFDLLLQMLHNLTNTDKCPEGISPNDEFRIVQYATSPAMASPFAYSQAPRSFFDVPKDDRFYLLRQIGRYSVLKRDIGAARTSDSKGITPANPPY
jgi:hypothetical protein